MKKYSERARTVSTSVCVREREGNLAIEREKVDVFYIILEN